MDTLQLTNYSVSEAKLSVRDLNQNGNTDSLFIELQQGNQANSVTMVDYYDDTVTDPPFCPGPGYIETIQWRGTGSPAATMPRPLRSAGSPLAGCELP
jgi:hypothetical protein